MFYFPKKNPNSFFYLFITNRIIVTFLCLVLTIFKLQIVKALDTLSKELVKTHKDFEKWKVCNHFYTLQRFSLLDLLIKSAVLLLFLAFETFPVALTFTNRILPPLNRKTLVSRLSVLIETFKIFEVF